MGIITYLLFSLIDVSAQSNQVAKADSTNTGGKKEEKGRNVMLNAASNNGPREINIGLPGLATGMAIRENGVPVSWTWPEMPIFCWRPGVGSAKVGLLSMAERALTIGQFGYAVSADSRIGGDKLDIRGSVSSGSFGWLRSDVAASGPIANNWSFVVGVFSDNDPGSTDLAFAKAANTAEVYRFGLTKRFNNNKGKVSFLFKRSKAHWFTDQAVSRFKGNGEVEEIEGLRMGRDSYALNTGTLRLLDSKSGAYYNTHIGTNDDENISNAFYVFGDLNLKNNWKLDYTLNYRYTETSIAYLAYTGVVDAGSDVTYMDGSAYTGEKYQVVLASSERNTPQNSLQARFELKKQGTNHSTRIGLMNNYYQRDKYANNRSFFAQEIAAQPRQLMVSGKNADGFGFWGYNANAEYNDGNEDLTTLYFIDNFKVTPNLNISYGANVRYQTINGNRATNRSVGWTLASADLEDIDYDFFNYSANIDASYNITKYFGFTGQFLYNTENGNLKDFSTAQAPAIETKVKTPFFKIGVFINHPKISLVSAYTHVTKNNFNKNLNLTNPLDRTETESQKVFYDIKTSAWVNDIIAKPIKNFSLHYNLTIQNPVYDSFKFSAFGKDYDYSGNNVTQISKVLMEIDPRYTFWNNKMTVWASARYFSKQYASITNALFFNGWWETFGGVNYRMNKNLSADIKVVNLLNQRGVKNEISGSELDTDESYYVGNYIVSSFIRPLTVEASLKFNF